MCSACNPEKKPTSFRLTSNVSYILSDLRFSLTAMFLHSPVSTPVVNIINMYSTDILSVSVCVWCRYFAFKNIDVLYIHHHSKTTNRCISADDSCTTNTVELCVEVRVKVWFRLRLIHVENKISGGLHPCQSHKYSFVNNTLIRSSTSSQCPFHPCKIRTQARTYHQGWPTNVNKYPEIKKIRCKTRWCITNVNKTHTKIETITWQ